MKNEGNLEGLFNSLDKIVEEAKDREEPAWYGGPGVGVMFVQGQQAVLGQWLYLYSNVTGLKTHKNQFNLCFSGSRIHFFP